MPTLSGKDMDGNLGHAQERASNPHSKFKTPLGVFLMWRGQESNLLLWLMRPARYRFSTPPCTLLSAFQGRDLAEQGEYPTVLVDVGGIEPPCITN